MRRQINHHLARARAIGRRAAGHARAEVWPSLEAVARAVSRMHSHATVDITGDRHAAVAGERQDLEEMIGHLIANAAKYGRGRGFVTVERNGWRLERRRCGKGGVSSGSAGVWGYQSKNKK